MRLFTDSFQQLKKASVPLYRTPKSIQETIEILKVAENGIFEVRKGHYSKSYRFQDINYTTTTEGEQLSIIERYCKLLNSSILSPAASFTIARLVSGRLPRKRPIVRFLPVIFRVVTAST